MFKHYPECPFYYVPKHGSFTAQKAASAEIFRDSCRAKGQERDIAPFISTKLKKKKNFENCLYCVYVHVILLMHPTGQ